ncbi:MMPL family transporter [Micromonospora sp. NBC_01796]|uniref:MMPL family transporter n=1 Tax=Micromonospora sp. NBC_01796 TaxID=2975987 RepID=UPI002DDB9CCC|nr:MMPL family transporter [Micromonospora sp. NBC_01796]WSA88787.1 MMPL family transporter [Micromonospora sp. NBC_01796]
MFGVIGRAVVRRPWLVILGWVVAAVAIIATAPGLGSVTNSDQSAFLPDEKESSQAARLAEEAFPAADGASAVIVVERTDRAPLADPDVARLGQLAGQLNAGKPAAVAGVVFDPAQQVAPNRAVALLAAQFTGAPEQEDVQQAVRDLRGQLDDVLEGTGLTAGVTGEAAIVVDNKQSFADAEVIVTIATVTLIVLLLLLIFRSPIAAFLPLLTVGLVLGVSTSLVAVAATAFDFEIGQELPILLTVVLFGIGTDYILFLLFRYRERLRAGDSPTEAVISAVERVGEAIFSAAFAVIAAFSALALASLGFFATLGPGLAIATAVMLLAALTLAPAIVTVLGRRVFWPSRKADQAPPRTRFATVGAFVARRPIPIIVGTVVVLVALSAGALTFKSDYDPIGQLPPDTEATRAFEDLQRGFPAGALQPTNVYLRADRPLIQDEIGAMVQRLAAVDGVASPMPPQVSPDGRTANLPLILTAPPFEPESLDLVSGPLRDTARAAAPSGTEVLIGGQSMAYADVRDTTERDFSVIFPVAGLLFVLILAGLLGALLAPIYLVAMVVLGFVGTLGATALLFQQGLGRTGLSFIIPIILYLFVTAIGTDYNILVTARLREEIRDGRTARQAAALAVEHAGPSVAAAALILAGTFGSLMISGVPFFVEIGFAVTLGIVLVAFVVSILLVPAVTALVGRAAWWPGGRSAATAEMDEVEETDPALTGRS